MVEHAGREVGSGDARARLLDAARTSFADKGFHGTTTRDIAAAAGMSPAAVYVHHRTKEALLYELSLTGHQEILTRLEAARAAYDAPVDRLRALARTFALAHAEGHTSARIVNYELAALSDEHRVVIDGLRHAIQQHFRDAVADGVATGQFQVDDVAMTANSIVGMGVDIARWYHDGGSWSSDRVADHAASIALRMVGAHETP